MQKNFHILLALFCCFAISVQSQTLYPYLQSPSPNSIYVTWKTSSNTQSLVQYGLTSGNLNMTANGGTQIWSDNGYPSNYYYHTVKLTGLAPNTKYYYKITTGASTSAVCCFKTLPLPGQASTSAGHLRFLIMGDNQIKSSPRFDSLVSAAKRKIYQKWGGDPCDNVTLNFMVGDQVDVGTLDHYEWVHFDKNKLLSPYVPIQTTVGNHETYGTLQMSAYYNHFYLDSVQYGNIPSGTENYYAMQAGNVLFLSLTTEHASSNAAQFNWVQQVVNYANTDATVDWIVTLSHRPYQAEQYVGDISSWVRNTVVPFCVTSPKYLMHIGAHHHIYARGQLKNSPVYNITSGGTAWDQYWGMSTETDFDDIQKTISNWIYQIIDVDVTNGKVDVESYSIGGVYKWKDNELMDSFHRYKNKPGPLQPSITNAFPDSLQLPYTITSSAFSSPASELLNSTQFQFSQNAAFSTTEIDKLRDYENLFGSAGAPDTTTDVNAGVNILNYDIAAGQLPNGWHYVRARHRDRNLEWSSWSATDSFKVYGSVQGFPFVSTDTIAYEITDTVRVTYGNGPGNAQDWIGIYKKGDVPGATGSTQWSYVNGTSGTLNFTNLPQAGEYFAAFFENNGYTELASRAEFYVGPIPVLTTDQPSYPVGDTVKVSYANAPGLALDWIGIYKIGLVPGVDPSVQWSYAGGTNGTLNFVGLPKGYYFAAYYIEDGYTQIGHKAFFSVGDTITTLLLDKSIYNLQEYITATWSDAPGIIKDWLGIYNAGDNPNIDPLVTYTYFGGLAQGSKVLQDSILPPATGNYFIVMFTNDSYNEVSNRVYFTVIDTSATTATMLEKGLEHGIKLYPNPSNGHQKAVIESEYPIEKIELLNGEGQVVFSSRNVNSDKFSFITQDLPAGTYFVKVYTRKVYTYKLVVTR